MVSPNRHLLRLNLHQLSTIADLSLRPVICIYIILAKLANFVFADVKMARAETHRQELYFGLRYYLQTDPCSLREVLSL